MKVSSSEYVAQVGLMLAGLMFVAPFLQPYHRFPLTAFYSEWLAFALGLAAALFLLRREPWRGERRCNGSSRRCVFTRGVARSH